MNTVAMSDLCPTAVSEVSSAVKHQPQSLQEASGLLLKDKEYCDVTFTFPNLPDRIEAHELFLKARSPVFKQIFRMRKSGNVQGKEIEISESTPQIFHEFLEFIYMDKFEENATGALDLLHLAKKYKVEPLMTKCEELLKGEVEVDQSVQVYETARRYGRDELVDRAGELMVKSLGYLIENGALGNAEEETLIYLLERDDLAVKEVDLFEFILKWGKDQVEPSDDAHLLLGKLKKVILLIRYTNMTPYEFNAKVSPTGLLSAQEMLSIYSYFAADESMRKDIKIKFKTTPRQAVTCVDFYSGNENAAPQCESTSSSPFKQCLSFQVQTCKKLWPSSKNPAITGIKVKWPSRTPYYSTLTDESLNFNVYVKECCGPVKNQYLMLRFEKDLVAVGCKGEEEIPVEPAVELISGLTYFVIVEDQSQHYRFPDYSHGNQINYNYSGVFSPYDLSPVASVDLGGVDLKFAGIQKDGRLLSGFSCSAAPFPINVIRGITVALV